MEIYDDHLGGKKHEIRRRKIRGRRDTAGWMRSGRYEMKGKPKNTRRRLLYKQRVEVRSRSGGRRNRVKYL